MTYFKTQSQVSGGLVLGVESSVLGATREILRSKISKYARGFIKQIFNCYFYLWLTHIFNGKKAYNNTVIMFCNHHLHHTSSDTMLYYKLYYYENNNKN